MGEIISPPLPFMKKIYFALISLTTLLLSSCEMSFSFPFPAKSSVEDNSETSIMDTSSFDTSSVEEITSSEEPSYFKGYAPEGYVLAWHDEFSAQVLSDEWECMIGDGSNYGVYRWGNNEEQYYTDDNAYVDDDNLHIVAYKERRVTEQGDVYQYTSARLRTKGKVTTTYGYIEARIKLPVGTGLWPAFWMLPEGNFADRWWPTSGEIDIMEARGRLPGVASSTIHSGNANNQDVYQYRDYNFPEGEDISDYHCYGVEWTDKGFKFYVDGNFFFEVTPKTYQNNNPLYTESSASAPFDRPFHLLLNLAIGGNYDGGKSVSNDFREAEMLVDYVRIFD